MYEHFRSTRVSRRGLLATAGGAASLAALALSGCAPQQTPGQAPPQRGGVTMPSFVPYTGVKPDLPALENGTSAYFASLPAEPQQILTEKPASGGEVHGFTILNNAPVPLDRNPFWQGINDLLGTNLVLTGAPAGGYASKFQTLVAGGDLPDFCCVLPSLTTQLGSMLKARFTDLTDHLAGDAIKDYPALANIPSYNWSGSVYNNGIYLIPSPRFALFRTYVVREDLAVKAGVDPQPKDGKALAEMLTAFSNSRENKFATVSARGLLDMVNEMMGTPNNWVEDGGRFSKDYESESFAAALDFVAQAWSKGQIHPDAFSPSLSSTAGAMYASDQSPLFPNVPSWSGNAILAKQENPEAKTSAITLKAWDGGSEPVRRWLGAGTPYLIGIPQTDPDRVREVLRVINALASPFGTKEFNQIKYGNEGADYKINSDGSVARTEQGSTNRVGAVIYLGSPALVHFGADPEIVKDEYLSEKADMDHTAPQPNVGLVSETNLKEGAGLVTRIDDLISGIIQGRKTMEDWKAGVAEWKSRGGDTIRGEYEKAFADAKAAG